MKEKEVAGENEEEEEGKKILWHPHRKTDRYNTVWKQRTALASTPCWLHPLGAEGLVQYRYFCEVYRHMHIHIHIDIKMNISIIIDILIKEVTNIYINKNNKPLYIGSFFMSMYIFVTAFIYMYVFIHLFMFISICICICICLCT